MTSPSASPSTPVQPLIRLPMWKLTACLLAAPKAVLLVALLVALIVGGDLWDDRLRAEFWAGVVLYTGTGAGLGFLWLFGPRPAFTWGAIVIGGSVIRMAVSVSAAMAIAVTLKPETGFFWTVFLIASLLILAVETYIIRRSLMGTIALSRSARAAGTESKAA